MKQEEHVAASLTKRGFISRPCTAAAASHISHVVHGWNIFLNSNERADWTFDVEGDGDPDDGYIRRSGNNHDFKHFFHYRPRLWSLLDQRDILSGMTYGHGNALWLEACGGLYRACEKMLYEVLASIDTELPGFSLEHRAREHGIHVLRLLRYDQANERGGVIAKPHTDKSLMTIHIADSHPGLRFGPSGHLHRPRPNEVCFFPGKKAELISDGTLPALEHCVTDEFPGEERWSIVFFGHCDVSAFTD